MTVTQDRPMDTMTDTERYDALRAAAGPITPEQAEQVARLTAVWVAGWHHACGTMVLTGAERAALFAGTVAPDLAAAYWDDAVADRELFRQQ
jgi:hypothetical protein